MRIGIGFDSHALVPGRPLVLGGVRIPSPVGLQGHSDGDVLTHAVADALLGAVAAGDLGTHFPSADPAFEGACSLDLLEQVVDLLSARGWVVVNVDAVIVAERPHLAPHVAAMRAALAARLRATDAAVSVKATTTDGLGAAGRGEGMSAQAVALVRRDVEEGA